MITIAVCVLVVALLAAIVPERYSATVGAFGLLLLLSAAAALGFLLWMPRDVFLKYPGLINFFHPYLLGTFVLVGGVTGGGIIVGALARTFVASARRK
jgi:hypothetical protein